MGHHLEKSPNVDNNYMIQQKRVLFFLKHCPYPHAIVPALWRHKRLHRKALRKNTLESFAAVQRFLKTCGPRTPSKS